MKNKKIRFTFTIKFTLVVLLIIVLNTGIFSAIFLYNLFSISYTLAKTNVEKSIENFRGEIISMLNRYADLLDNASYGIGALFDQGLNNIEDMSGYFGNLIDKMPEIDLLYFSSNNKWNESGGYWIASPVWIPEYEEWDQRVRPWFINAKEAAGNIAFSEPFLDAKTGETIISISRVVFDGQGRDIGVIAVDMLVTKLNEEINRTLVFPEQQIFLLNNKGLYITNPNQQKIMLDNFFAEKNIEQYYERVLLYDTLHFQESNYNFFAATVPYANWQLVSMTPDSAIYAEPNNILWNIILLFVLIFAVSIGISIIFTYFMLNRPLKDILKIFKQLNNNDLNVQLNAVSNDEMGDLMNAMNVFLTRLKSTFNAFNSNTSMVSSAVLELSTSAIEITTTANEQSASVAEIISTMENNKNLTAQASEKTEEVASLAAQTQELSRRGADLRDVNEDMMLDIRNQNAKIIDIIRNLTDMLSRIDESILLIDTIADHTKLIAFNATLEASSSGEAGSRFSVVASEIRRFADNVVASASEIKEKISELQEASKTLLTEANSGTQAIDTGYNRMVEQKEVFESIVDVSQNVAIRSQQISSLSKQQEYASAQVFTALKEISTGVNQFVSATNMTSAAVDKLNNMSLELKETLMKYTTEK
ncbi:MAG: methyl-accepting chemotaxis protein [Treponema sp.]|nr:methyl-accepting chemotaxis protein [Treponema sp.]